MQERKFRVAVARFPYAGNGNCQSESPDIGDWLMRVAVYAERNQAVIETPIFTPRIADTPITMARNRIVRRALEKDVDFLFMVDSDMAPDEAFLRKELNAVPFFETAFDFLRGHYDRGPAAIAAPYVGGPEHEAVHAYRWKEWRNPIEDEEGNYYLEAIPRDQAALLHGISTVAACGTGLIAYDMRLFRMLQPEPHFDKALWKGWFYYEWKDETCSEKATTEDVAQTRDMSVAGICNLGYNPLHIAWNCWAGHHKPRLCVKPTIVSQTRVPYQLRASLLRGVTEEMGIIARGNDPEPDQLRKAVAANGLPEPVCVAEG